MIKVGVLGAGHLGKIHIKLLKEIEGVRLVGFFDSDGENAARVSKEFDIPAFPCEDDLIDAVDAVDIVTPTLFHFDGASRALKKFRHVFIEKPVTTTIEEAKSLLQLANEAKVKVQIGHVERFNPAFKAAREFCKHPMFIESHRLAQFNPRGTDVSVVLDLMIHDIDIVLSVVKANIKKISASGVAIVSESPDIANARIEFDNGCVANLTASRISMKNMRKSRFFQRDAYISVDFLDKEVNVIRLKDVVGEPDPFAMTIDLGAGKGSKQIIFEKPETPPVNAIKTELETFFKAINEDLIPEVTLHDGLNALDVAIRIIEKLKVTANFLEN